MKPAAKTYIDELNPYQPGLPIDLVARQYGIAADQIIKLASNENPVGMGPRAKAAIKEAVVAGFRYPEQFALLQALSKNLSVEPEQLVLGNGSNDVLDLVARTFLGQGDEAISSQFGFAVYQIATTSAGATNVVIPAKEYGHDLPAMLSAITNRTKVIWIANPNNPTGTFVSYNEVKRFMEQVPPEVVVVLDEAYYEYLADEDRADTVAWLNDFANLILVRTFSKVHGLAGLRLGYGIASKALAEHLNRVRQPFNANSLAMAAAIGALQDTDFVAQSIQNNTAGKKILVDGLKNLSLNCLPAYGNFVTFEVQGATAINEALLQKGIIVRPLAAYGMPDYLRVTVGTTHENSQFLRALSEVLPTISQ